MQGIAAIDRDEVLRLRDELADTRAALIASRTQARSVAHDARNILQLAASLISLQRRGKSPIVNDELDTVDRRFRALAAVFMDMRVQSSIEMDLGDCLQRLGAVVHMQGGPEVAVDVGQKRCVMSWRAGAKFALGVTEAMIALITRDDARLSLIVRTADGRWLIQVAAPAAAGIERRIDAPIAATLERIRMIVPGKALVNLVATSEQTAFEVRWDASAG